AFDPWALTSASDGDVRQVVIRLEERVHFAQRPESVAGAEHVVGPPGIGDDELLGADGSFDSNNQFLPPGLRRARKPKPPRLAVFAFLALIANGLWDQNRQRQRFLLANANGFARNFNEAMSHDH